MSFLCENITMLAVAALASALVWVFGGTRGDFLPKFVPWLVVILAEIMLCFPQRHRDESTYGARERAWSAIKRDPVVWIALAFLALLAVPFVNNGLCEFCDAAIIATGVDPAPPLPVLPFCVNRLDHFSVFLWFASALTAMIAVRHCLVRRGKRLLVHFLVWNGVAVAAFGFLQGAMGAPGPFWRTDPGTPFGASYFFATFGYPNMAGDYFTVLFGLSVALWRDRIDELDRVRATMSSSEAKVGQRGQWWRRHYPAIPTAICFFAAINSLSRAAIILTTATAALYFVHTLVGYLAGLKKAKRVVVGTWCTMAFLVLTFFAMKFMPENVRKEVDTLDATTVLNRVSGKGADYERMATAIWGDHLLFGCGGWGYKHFAPTKLPAKDRGKLAYAVGGANVHNDYLQFLAEHGLVGFGALVAAVVLLLWPIGCGWYGMAKGLRFKTGKDLPPKPVQIFVLPAAVLFILIAIGTTLVHAFGDCPLRSPAILTQFFIALAVLPGFMPKDGQYVHHHHHHHHHH